MVPPTSVTTVVMRKNQPGSMTTGPTALCELFETDGNAVGLERGEHHGQVAGVLVDLLAALLAFLLQGLELRRHRAHQLHDDRRRDVGHDVEREDRHALDGTAREHVEHAEDAGRVGVERLREGGGIDARQRNEGAEAVDDERAEGELDAPLQILGFGEGAEVQIGGKLLGSGYHGSFSPSGRACASALRPLLSARLRWWPVPQAAMPVASARFSAATDGLLLVRPARCLLSRISLLGRQTSSAWPRPPAAPSSRSA